MLSKFFKRFSNRKHKTGVDDDVWWLSLGPDTPPEQSALGDKGTNLVRLMQAGFTVPGGVILTARLFHDFYFLEESAIKHMIDEAIRPYARPDTLWAICSSAGTKDSFTGLFSGSLETALNVCSGELFDRVKQLQAAICPDPVQIYQSPDNSVSWPHLAVILQQMIPARCAGVLYTPHPEGSAVGGIVVEGLPVSGENPAAEHRNPDRVEISHNGQRLLEHTSGRTSCLNQVDDEAFIRLARELEKAFGTPQDAAWSYDGKTLWVLQSRPSAASQKPPAG